MLVKIVSISAAACSFTQAAVLDWDVVNWTSTFGSGTSASQTFTNANSSGVDVTITVAAGPSTTNAELSSSASLPDDTNSTISHNYDTQTALMVDVNFTDNTNDYVQFTIQFSKAVANVNFELWDIDLGNSGTTSRFQDVVQTFTKNGSAATPTFTLLGSNSADGNTNVDASIVGNTIVGIASNGSTTNLGNENDALNSGDVRVSYDGGGITSISFQYWSGDGSPPLGSPFGTTNTTLQRIALADINFTPVPEVFSGMGALVVCGFAAGGSLFGRQRYRAQMGLGVGC